MDYDLIRTALFVLGAVVFYAGLARGLLKVTEQYRWTALELAERLIDAPHVSVARKASLQRRLGEVYSSGQAWKLAALMVCVIAMMPFKAQDESRAEVGVPHHLRNDFDRFKLYWMVSTVANSPAAALLFATLVIIAVAFSASISVISARLAFARDHHNGHNGANAT
jgi:hypothetical protein